MTGSKKQRILLLMALMISMLQIALAQEDCTLKKDKDGIKVYSCKTSGESLNIVQAEFDLYSSVDRYLNLVRDIENYKNWHFRVLEPRELSRINDYSIIYYTQISAPWPVSNRDLVLHLTLSQNEDGSLLVKLNSLPNYIPEKPDFVRIPFSQSEMQMIQVTENHLKVSYWIKADPGGSLPNWVTNMVSTQGPYETFKKMKDLLESESDTLSSLDSNSTSIGPR